MLLGAALLLTSRTSAPEQAGRVIPWTSPEEAALREGIAKFGRQWAQARGRIRYLSLSLSPVCGVAPSECARC